MNIAVLGKSRRNIIIEKLFQNEGMNVLLFQDLNEIKSVKGEAGSFEVNTREKSFNVNYIIVTEEPHSVCEVDEHKNLIMLEDNCVENLPYSKNPVVFILDYPYESPTYITRTALERSISLAKRKRKVVYLARFLRTAGDGIESLYKEARNLGVVFFKYNNVNIEFDEGLTKIKACDNAGDIEIIASAAVVAGRETYSEAFLKIIKLLKLKLDESSHVNEDCFFLSASTTSRKGIYYLNFKDTSESCGETAQKLQYILSEIKGFDKNTATNSNTYARIDAEKCAFCYTCYRTCPHFAMTPDSENSVMKNRQISCYGCGICVSVCPANAISMEGKASNNKCTVGSLKVFCCNNSGEIAYNRIAKSLKEDGLMVEMTPVSCGGELSADTLISALKEFDRILVAVCMDDACRHFEGNKRAKRQVDRVKEMLKATDIDENRILLIQLSHAMPAALYEYIKEMA